jgi:regulator of sigma D
MNSVSHEPLHERRARTRKEIKQLISERNTVLSQYYNLVNLIDQSQSDLEADAETIHEQLEEFCQELVDYLATGHFEIYRRIEDGDERRSEIVELAGRLFPRIAQTTEVAINFNDLYDDSNNIDLKVLQKLPEQLTRLGEELATRIDLEDQFINTLLSTPVIKPSTNESLSA